MNSFQIPLALPVGLLGLSACIYGLIIELKTRRNVRRSNPLTKD